MAQNVKKERGGRREARGAGANRKHRLGRSSTKVSTKNQITIPAAELRAAGLESGDVVHVEAVGTGQIVLTHVEELLARYAGALDTGGQFRRHVDELREEWR